MRIAKTAVIYPQVKLGEGAVVEDYCVIGAPLRDGSTPETVIGPGAWLRSHTVIYAGNKIGANFQTGNKANIRENNEIGDDVSIGTLSVIEHHVKIGSGVRIHTSTLICEFSVLEDRAWLGPHIVSTNVKIPRDEASKKAIKGPTLKKDCIVGGNVTLSPGVVVGEGALVGSGTNVTKDVPDHSVFFGPAGSVRGNRP